MDSPTMTNPGSVSSSNDDTSRVKFLCSFSGSILPRPQDGKLRYVGGETRIVCVPRDISYEELMAKMREIYEGAMVLKYQQPDEDLDALVSVVNDDDVVNMMEEYDKLDSGDGFTRLRIFLFLHPDQDGSLHFCDGDERENERRYVDALNSLNESPDYRTGQHNEFQVTGPLDDLHGAEQCFSQMTLDGSLHNLRSNEVPIPQVNLRHLTIPHLGIAQPQQSVNQRYNEMEAPWSPAYYSPRQPGYLDPRPLSEFPNSPSSSRYYSPYPEFQERNFDRLPEEYSRLQVNHSSLYDHQPQYTDNALLFPNGPVVDKAGFPGNILHGATAFEGNSICEHCRMTFQRNQPHPDSSWRPGEHSLLDTGNGFHQVANPCAECPPKREMFPVTTDASLHHSYYPVEQNDLRSRQGDIHSHERGWSVQHQPNARVEEPQIHASGAGSNLVDGHQVLGQGLNNEDLRHIRTGRDPGSQVYHDQVVGTGSQIHLPSMEDRGVRYGNSPYAYGPDTAYQVPQANMPAHSLWRNIQNPSHGGPSYEVGNSPQLVNGSASPGFVRGIMENIPRLQSGMENQNAWLDSSQKKMVFDGFSIPEYSLAPSQNLISNAHNQGNQPMHTVEAIQAPGGMQTIATLQDPVLKSDSGPFFGDRPATLSRSGIRLTADICASEKESIIRQEGEQLCPSGLAEVSNICSSSPTKSLMDTIPLNPVSPVTTCPENAVKECVSADTETIDACITYKNEKPQKDQLTSLSNEIPSAEKVASLSVKDAKAEVQENADSTHEHDTAKVVHENDAELADDQGGLEFDSDNDNVNNSKIESTKAEEEAIERGLQTIKNEDLEEIRELGSGTYGSVFHGKWKGSDVAIKRIKASCFSGRPSDRERLIADFWRDSVENMKGLTTPLQSKYWHPTAQNNLKNPESFNLYSHPVQFNGKNNSPISRKVKPISCFSSENTNQPISKESKPPLVVVGSANADIYVEIDRLPKEGETISAKTGQTLAGGKGANQAVCGGKLDYPTFFVGQVGEDAHGKLITEALESGGVCVDHLTTVSNAPTGNAVVMLQSDGENSIIIVGGANMSCWPEELSYEDLEIVRSAGIVLLQREIPDFVNIQVAKAARNAGVPVILDAGGADSPIPLELLRCVEIFSPNETELARITKMPTGNFEQISNAVEQCYDLGVNQVLVKLGANGSALFTKGEEPLRQPIIKAAKVIDTTGAGDTFTAAFAVALVEGKSKEECLRFAAAAASLCVQVKGAIPSMPEKRAVFNLLQSA